MRRRLRPALLLAASLLAPAAARAQPAPVDSQKLVFSGQVRLRSELDDRHVLADERVNVHLLRTRLRASARPAPGISVLAELQDARHLGSGDPRQGRGTTDPSADGLDMRQAWAQLQRP
ncbi:MAG TPA: hypothetical protein VEW03_03940, partial [Longimicrobiaceae bacterium]|nr:hypothetical protein [Longimicrobiaceae bacterium]